MALVRATKQVSCDLDLESKGKRFGRLDLIHSDNEHSFAVIPIPLCIVVGGPGKTLLLCAGTHGDEYEGQVILRRLIHDLDPDRLAGRVILLPALNYPAVRAGRRVSPLDGGNLNRCFPGREGASPSAAIAHFMTTEILPLCDAGIDLHSGGPDACYAICSYLCTTADRAVMASSLKLAEAFAAPFTYVMRGEEVSTGFDPAAQARGIPFISTELAGGGAIDPAALAVGRSGIAGVMASLGMIEPQESETKESVFLDGSSCWTIASPVTGLFESCREPGEAVTAGEPAGRIYPFEEIDRPPLDFTFEKSGRILAKRTSLRVVPGSLAYVVAPEGPRDQVLALAGMLLD